MLVYYFKHTIIKTTTQKKEIKIYDKQSSLIMPSDFRNFFIILLHRFLPSSGLCSKALIGDKEYFKLTLEVTIVRRNIIFFFSMKYIACFLFVCFFNVCLWVISGSEKSRNFLITRMFS